MADNYQVNTTTSSGAIFGGDEIGGIQFPRVKLIHGADGTNAGDVSTANPLPVDIRAENASITVDQATAANLNVTEASAAAILTAVQVIDNPVVVDDAAFTPATTSVMMAGFEYDDTTPDSVDEGDAGAARMSANRNVYVQVRDAAGNERGLNVDSNGDIGITSANLTTLAGAVSGSEMQVDIVAALPAGTNAIGKLAANSGVDIGDVDILSVVPGTGATNLGKAEDAAHTTGDVGVMMLAVRQDSQADFGADGDYVPLSIDANGAVRVSGGGGGTEYNEDDSTPATIVGTATLMERDDTLGALTPIEGDWAGLRCNARGALWVELDPTNALDVSGATVTVDLAANNDVTIDGSTVIKTEDTAHNTGDTGLMALAVRRDADTTLVGTDGDYAPLQVNAAGALKVEIFDGGDSLTVDASELTTLAGAVSGSEMQVDIVAALPAGTNAIGKLAANSGVDIGDVDILSIAAGSNLVGDVGLSGARTSGGTTLYKNIDVDESEDQIKATAGQVYWIHAINLSSAVKYLKFYNATAASVTVGTTVPDLTFPIPTQGDTNGAGFTISIPNGIAFGTAITIAATTGVADNDSGAPGANEVVVNLGYA